MIQNDRCLKKKIPPNPPDRNDLIGAPPGEEMSYYHRIYGEQNVPCETSFLSSDIISSYGYFLFGKMKIAN